jgi:hypothetical protein
VALRREIQDLRASIDVLAEAVDRLLKANDVPVSSGQEEASDKSEDEQPELRKTEEVDVL